MTATELTIEEPPSPLRARLAPAVAPAAAVVTLVLWASAFVGIRSAGHTLSPGALTLGRLAIGGVALALVAAVRRERLPARADVRAVAPVLLLCGLLWFGGYNLALNAGERRVDAGTAAMLVGVGPLLVAVLAGLVLREGFPRALIAGCLVAFAGVVVIGIATSDAGATAGGILLCLLAAGAYAGGVVAQKPVLRRLGALHTTLACCAIGGVACLPFAPQLARELHGADTAAIAWLVYLGVFPTAVAFTTWAYALARTGAGRLAATTYVVPPLAVLLGWLLLHEPPPELAVVGGALALVGVGISRRKPRTIERARVDSNHRPAD